MIISTLLKSTVFLTVALLFVLLFFPAQAAENSNNTCHYTVGVVPQFEQRRLFSVWKPITEMLSEKTGCSFELIGSKSIIEFEKAFKEGLYDFAYMNPYHAVMAKKAQGYEPIIRSGTKKLKGILVAHKDTDIGSLSDLTGQNVAFPSPNALGASLLMRAELATKHDSTPEPLYVKTHSSVYLHVAKGLTIAGGGVGRTLNEQSDYIKDALKIIYTTTPVYAHPLVSHPRVTEDMRNKVQTLWTDLAAQGTDLFDGIPMQQSIATSYADYKELEEFGLEQFIGTKD